MLGMIHTILVSPETEHDELKKLMRKKLMTGGAVIRLSSELSNEQLEEICRKFSPLAERFSLAAEVLIQVAKHRALDSSTREELRTIGLPELSRTIAEHEPGRP